MGPAMTRDEALRGVEVGIETARDLVAAGNSCLLTGDWASRTRPRRPP